MSGDGLGGVFGIIAFQQLRRLPAPIRFSNHEIFFFFPFLFPPTAFSRAWSTFPQACTHIMTLALNISFCDTLKNSGILNSLTVTFIVRVIREKPSSPFLWICQGQKLELGREIPKDLHCHSCGGL